MIWWGASGPARSIAKSRSRVAGQVAEPHHLPARLAPARASCHVGGVSFVLIGGLLLATAVPELSDGAVWIGLASGPLGPRSAEALERGLVAALDARERLTDVAGWPLGPKEIARAEAQVRALRDRGVDAYLSERYLDAHRLLREARDHFEARLAGLGNPALYEDILLAEAEADWQRGERGRAMETLKRLWTQTPRRVPEPGLQPDGLVKVWRRLARRGTKAGRLRLSCNPACMPWVDGQPLAELRSSTELTGLRPGPHRVSARWPGRHASREVEISGGAETRLSLELADAAETARQRVLTAALLRPGEASELLASALAVSEAPMGWLAVARPLASGEAELQLALVGPSGAISGARLVVERTRPPTARALEDLVRRAAIEPDPDVAQTVFAPPPEGAERPSLVEETLPVPSEPRPWYAEPWIWIVAGVVVVGAAGVGIAAASSGAPEGVVDVGARFP